MVKGFCSIKAFAPPTHLPPTLQYFTTCRMVFLILPKPAQLGFILLSFRWRCRPSVWRLCGVLLQPDVLSVEIQDTLSGQDQGRHSNEPLRFDNHNPGWIYSTAAAASIWKIIILGHKFRRNSNNNSNSNSTPITSRSGLWLSVTFWFPLALFGVYKQKQIICVSYFFPNNPLQFLQEKPWKYESMKSDSRSKFNFLFLSGNLVGGCFAKRISIKSSTEISGGWIPHPPLYPSPHRTHFSRVWISTPFHFLSRCRLNLRSFNPFPGILAPCMGANYSNNPLTKVHLPWIFKFNRPVLEEKGVEEQT